MTVPFDCPRCGAVLAMTDRQGIEIDYCPQCRGVWLDRGELDKLIERAADAEAPRAAPSAPPPQPQPSAWTQPAQGAAPYPPAGWSGGHGGRHGGQPYGHKRKSWLKEIFD